jgi:hypothetical protein
MRQIANGWLGRRNDKTVLAVAMGAVMPSHRVVLEGLKFDRWSSLKIRDLTSSAILV